LRCVSCCGRGRATAAWWAYEQGWRRMVVVWIVAVAVYLVIRVLAAF
jgi:hypothetical protein